MTYERFCEELKSLGLDVPAPQKAPKRSPFSDTYYGYMSVQLVYPERKWGEKTDDTNQIPALVLRWTTGGTSGGSCWDDGEHDNHYSREGEPQPDWDDLHKILEHLTPLLPFLQYKKLMKLVRKDSYTENEYYGNSTTYAVHLMEIKPLYEFLNGCGFLLEEPPPPYKEEEEKE
jgi:hypothetical protein